MLLGAALYDRVVETEPRRDGLSPALDGDVEHHARLYLALPAHRADGLAPFVALETRDKARHAEVNAHEWYAGLRFTF